LAEDKIPDYEEGKRPLFLRVLKGFILLGIIYFFLSYSPSYIWYLKKYLPPGFPVMLIDIVSEIIHPLVPLLGFLVGVLVFLSVVFYMTKAYGPLLIMAGLVYSYYVYLLFHGGVIDLVFPEVFGAGSGLTASLDLTIIMILAMLPAILTIAKGLLLTFK